MNGPAAPGTGAAAVPAPDVPARIALLVPTLAGGGISSVVLVIARGLAERGHAVDLVVFNRSGELDGRVPGNVRPVDLGTGKLVLALPKLVAYLKRARPGLVIAASWYAVLVALAAKRFCCPGIRVWVRQDNVHSIQVAHARRRNRAVLRAIRLLLPSAERIIAVSTGVAEDLKRHAPRIAARVSVVPNPVPHEDIAGLAAAAPGHPWFDDPDVPVILSAGRLVGQKDFPTLIRAFAEVVKSRPARLAILGEGRERDALAGLVRELGVDQAVALPGFVGNPFAWMARARVFAVSSIYEGLSMVLVEAMACGTPAVSTDCPHGPREVLQDGRWGPLVPVGDARALAAAILETLRDPPPPDALMARSRAFSVEACIARHVELMADRRTGRATQHD